MTEVTIAEIRGKISGGGADLSERMEDLMTSDVFGSMRYLPPRNALIPFLQTARSLRGNIPAIPDRVLRVHWSFWPWLRSAGHVPCEPDVVLGLETEENHVHVIMVEAKYYSGLSSEENESDEPNDQLARELDNLDVVSCGTLGWRTHSEVASRMLLFVTQDMGIPRGLLARSLAEYTRKRSKEGDIYWASWRFLPSILASRLEEEITQESRAVLDDMLMLLLRKGLIMFGGVDPVAEFLTLPEFYHPTPTRYSWPDVRDVPCTDYVYEVTR